MPHVRYNPSMPDKSSGFLHDGLVVYATKYGSTREYAETLARRLDIPAVQAVEARQSQVRAAVYLVVGSPIYGPSVLPAMKHFISKFKDILSLKPVAAFVVCGDTLWMPKAGEGGHANLEKLVSLLPVTPVACAVFGGRMLMNMLDEEDRPRILSFYRKLGKEPTGFDRMDLAAAGLFAERIISAIMPTSG